MGSHASRFGAHLAALLSGALIVISVLAFRPAVAAWITLGLAALAVLGALTAFAMPDQGGARVTEVLLVLGGGWAIVASRVFSNPHVLKWLCLGSGAMIGGLGTLGLLAHEALMQGRLRRADEAELYRLGLARRREPTAVSDQTAAFR